MSLWNKITRQATLAGYQEPNCSVDALTLSTRNTNLEDEPLCMKSSNFNYKHTGEPQTHWHAPAHLQYSGTWVRMTPVSLAAHGSGFVPYIITSSNPTGTRWGSDCAFSHFQIKTLRSWEVKHTGPGQQVSWLSFVQESLFSRSSHLASAIASEDCHSQRSVTWRFHCWGCWTAALLTHLFHRLHEAKKLGALADTPSLEMPRPFSRWDGTAPTLGSLRYKFPCQHWRHFSLVFRLATNWDVITYCGCRRLWRQTKGVFPWSTAPPTSVFTESTFGTGVHWFLFLTTSIS